MLAVWSSFARRVRGLVVLTSLAAVAMVAACSSDTATRPAVSPNIALMNRFDSLYRVAQGDADLRQDVFFDVVLFLAEGAPVQMASVSFNGHVIRDSAVAVLSMRTSQGRATDSTLLIAMWDGHGPDTVISLVTLTHLTDMGTELISHDGFHADLPAFSNGDDTVRVTLSAPGETCASLLPQRPPDFNPQLPTLCQTQTFSISFKTLPQFGVADSVSMALQSLQGVRLQF
ncbi:MAG: hypothetical protein ACREND_02200 [Gemmatimonadaceae bacterium]